jgi:tetratricopeptide (TPR) repeat protein
LLAYHLKRFYYPNNLAGGLELLSLLLPLCPDNYVPHALLGDFLRKQQRHHESIARYRQAEELYDEKFDYHISLTHIQLGIAYDYLELARRVMQPNQKKSYLNQCRWELAICELLPWPTEREERRYYTATVLWGMTSYEHFNDFDALCQAKTATERLQVLTMTERSQRIIGLFNQTVELAIQRSRKK